MPITYDWDNREHTLILITYTPPWDWKDHAATISDVVELIDSGSMPVDIIVDMRHGRQFPGREGFSALAETMKRMPDNTRHLIVVGVRAFDRLENLWLRRHGYPMSFQSVATLDEAYRTLYDLTQA